MELFGIFSGALDRQGTIAGVDGAVPTAADGSFSAWVNAPSSGAVTVSATDYSSGSVSTSVTPSVVPAGSASYTYDANGNMLTGGGKTFTWDALDRLVKVRTDNIVDENNVHPESEFYYDGLGRRIRITSNYYEADYGDHWGSDAWYLWDGDKIVQERSSKDGSPSRWYFNDGEYSLVTFEDGGDYFDVPRYCYYKKDHLGSIRFVYVMPFEPFTNEDRSYTYDAYGNYVESLQDEIQTEGFNRLYTGHFYHSRTGLYLAPYRAYDPTIGRWLSREPLGLDGPNLYHYSMNCPVNLIDLLGLYSASFFPSQVYSAWPSIPPLDTSGLWPLGMNDNPLYTGTLSIWDDNGKLVWEDVVATSGAKGSKGPLPAGDYVIYASQDCGKEFPFAGENSNMPVKKYRLRDNGHTNRSGFLIHPSPRGGTLGCLGCMNPAKYQDLMDILEPYFRDPKNSDIPLHVAPYPISM